VGCNLSASIDMVPRAVILLRQRMPSVYVTVREGSLESLLPELRTRRLDIIVARTEQSSRSNDLREIILPDEPLVVVAAPDHPLSKKRNVRWKDLEPIPWIIAPPQSPVREGLERIFQLEGIEPLKIDLESVSSLANIHFMQELGAVTVMPRNVAQRFIRAGLASQLSMVLPFVFRPLAAITLRAIENSDVVSTFLMCLKETRTD
ncbi:MAG: hypothetical protein KDD44_14490, partial [Bdellovibrionales bacterium]|nr:hypothetical protein [Bdellovibrionales bacterium]